MTDRSALSPSFTTLGDESFVSLTTFRKSGEPVSTPVWIARDGDALIVTTPAESGKVKRLRNDQRVELRPCGRTGKVEEGVEPVAGVAEILTDDVDAERLTGLIRKKYRLEYRVMMAVERLLAGRRKPRVLLRVTAAS